MKKNKYIKPKVKQHKINSLFFNDSIDRTLLAYCFVCIGGCSAL